MGTFPPLKSISGPHTCVSEQPEPLRHRVTHRQGEGEGRKAVGQRGDTDFATHEEKGKEKEYSIDSFIIK